MNQSPNTAAGDNEGNQTDNTQITQLLQTLILEVRAMRLAVVSLAVQDGKADARDFDPQELASLGDNENDI